jgi:hypothetical protein
MRRFTGLIVATFALATVVLLPARGLAKSGYVRVPEPRLVRAGPPIPSDLDLSPSQVLGGCGTRRSRDPVTNKCRGPADFGN